MYGLCEGPISDILSVWVDKSINSGHFGFTVLSGAYSQTGWSYLNGAHPTQSLNYRGIAIAAESNLGLGSSAQIPNHTFEVKSAFTGAGGTPDANPKDVIVDFLTNTHYGVGWPAARLDTALSTYSGYCLAAGLTVSPALVDQKEAAAFLKDLMLATNSEFRWTEGQLTVVPYGETTISTGTINTATEPTQVPTTADSNSAYKITIAQSGAYYQNIGVIYSNTGIPLTEVTTGTARRQRGTGLSTGQYSVQRGVYYFASGDKGAQVTITYRWASTGSYVPDSTPLYDLTDSDFLPNQGGAGSGMSGGQPIIAVRKRKSEMLNSVKLEYLDRGNNYDPAVIEAKDQASIDVFGLRTSDLRQLHLFNTGAAASQSVILQLQREQTPNTYTFTLGPWFALARVLDLVTLTRSTMGMVRQGVRITEIQENADGSFSITAEEYMGTVGAPLFGPMASAATPINTNADPGSVNAPIVFEPTAQLLGTGGLLQIWGAVSGANPLWGGCNVWASYDGVDYAQVGTIRGPARMGTLTSALPTVATSATGATIDAVNTLAVDLTESTGTLLSASATDFAALNSKCYVGGEIIAYQTATLTAANKYNLTQLNRGGFGSTISAHAAGTSFARLDAGIFAFDYDQTRIGSTVSLKFQSFNLWGGGVQNLADVGAVSYTITGVALSAAMPNVTNIRNYFEAGFTKIYWDEVTDFRNGIVYEIRKGVSFAGGLTVGVLAHPPFVAFGDDTYWISARCQPVPGLIAYSAAAQSITIAGSVLTPNVIKTWDEKATGWSGYFSGGTVAQGSNPNAFVTNAGSYEVPVSHWIDVGYVTPVSISASWVGTGTPAGQDILTIADILAVADILGGASTAFIDVHLEIAISQVGVELSHLLSSSTVNESAVMSAWQSYETLVPIMVKPPAYVGDLANRAPSRGIITTARTIETAYPDAQGFRPKGSLSYDTFGPWQKFVPGVYLGRMFKMRMVLTSADPSAVPNGLSFTWSAIVPARIDHYQAQAVPATAGGLTITFKPDGATATAPFNFGPSASGTPFVSVAITGGSTSGDTVNIIALSLTSLQFNILNAGAPVARTCNVAIEGA